MPPNSNIEDIYELSPLQQGMLFHSVYEPESPVYFEQLAITYGDFLDVTALKRAWQTVVDRNPVLRTSFHWENLEKPLQVVHRNVELPFKVLDWRHLSREQQQNRLWGLLDADRTRGFRLSEAPVMRVELIRLTDQAYQFIWSFHHIILDGWSTHLLSDEMAKYYQAYANQRSIPSITRPPYSDYIAWLQDQDLEQLESFWLGQLADFSAPTPFGVDKPIEQGPQQAADFAEEQRRFSDLTAPLDQIARHSKLTMSTLVQGAWALLLSKYSGEDSVVYGMVTSGRPPVLKDVESIVGLFINTLPVRVSIPPGASLLSWLIDLQLQHAELRLYEYSPLLEVRQWSGIPKNVPLFESVLIFENHPGVAVLGQKEDEAESELFIHERTNLPLTVMAGSSPDLWFKLIYDCRRFDASTISRMLDHLEMLFLNLIANPEIRLADLSLLTEEEKDQIVAWNATEVDYPVEQSVATLFEEVVARMPDAPAFIENGVATSYRELDVRANRLAGRLGSLKFGAEALVGVCLERSVKAAIAMLAIFKAGAAYLPLDPSYPEERLAFIASDAGVYALITEKRLGISLLDARVPDIFLDQEALDHYSADNPKPADVSAGHMAYVIYTSGSTGRPKGAAVEHGQILNRLAWMWDHYPFSRDEVGCQKTALNFVDSLWELLGPLLKGIPTVIIPDAVLRDPEMLIRTLAEQHVTRIWVVPSFLRTLLSLYPDLQARLPDLRFWVSSGEALSGELFEQFQSSMTKAVLYNLYGTSEVWDVTWYDPQLHERPEKRVPIGHPISNMQAYILDANMQPTPIGVVGELYVGGAGLARSYIHRPALTAEKLVPDPFSRVPGARLYQTGDLARYLEDGNIDFIGRRDHQVKIHGFRIEPGEVEAILERHPRVDATAVTAHSTGNDDQELVAYVIPQVGKHLEPDELRGFLRQKLPAYLIPSNFMMLDAFPLTPSGKIDRKALPEPEHTGFSGKKLYAAPRTPLEEVLSGIFARVLNLESVGIHDDFFELGGHSLLAMRLVSQIREILQIDLPLRQPFEATTPADLASLLMSDPEVAAEVSETAELIIMVGQLSDEEVKRMLARGSSFQGGDETE
ncbi:MAG: amino acid adenylation domain-containing protein [Planctomycetota bacterium]|jgi:amino acid adenylation domain-containing protein